MVGGDAAAFGRLRPVWDAIGSVVVHVGPLGHGQIAKLANNLMGAVIVQAIAEGLTLAAKAGADIGRVVDAIAGGSGSSWILREWVPETVLRGDYARRFSLDLMSKDMRLVAELAGQLERPHPCVSRPHGRASSAQSPAGYGDDDFSRAIEFHARAADTTI